MTLSRLTLARLQERSAASGESFGREVDFCVREADADHARLRFAVLKDLAGVLTWLAEIRAATRHPEIHERVADVERAMAAARATLAKPSAAAGTRPA